MFEGAGFSPEITAAAETAFLVGEKLKTNAWPKTINVKSHATFGTSTVTPADVGAHRYILARLQQQFPGALFMSEEEESGWRPTFSELKEGIAFSDDAPDGTKQFVRGLPGWSVAIGFMSSGVHIGGAIVAPDINGGLMVVGERRKGVFLWERSAQSPVRLPEEAPSQKVPIISFGVDINTRKDFGHFRKHLPQGLQLNDLSTSSALGLALVAAGRIDALVQSPQMPWDWVAGYPLILESGRKIRCYHIVDGEILEIPHPIPTSYQADQQMLGFVAGLPERVDEMFELLRVTY